MHCWNMLILQASKAYSFSGERLANNAATNWHIFYEDTVCFHIHLCTCIL